MLHFDDEERRIYGSSSFGLLIEQPLSRCADAAEEEAQVVVQRYLKAGSLMKNMSCVLCSLRAVPR